MKKQYTPIKQSLCLADDEKLDTRICLERCTGVDPCGLYLVTLTRTRPSLNPATSMHYVLAPDEREAICQCENLAYPDCEYGVLHEDQKTSIEAVAVRLPLLIRGWGVKPF